MLRKKGVVDKFVEFFGDGLKGLPLADRATIANMSPEFGSTCAIFPIDEETIRYLELTGRPPEQIALVEAYAKAQGMWRIDGAPSADYTDVVELDLVQGRAVPRGSQAPARSGAAAHGEERLSEQPEEDGGGAHAERIRKATGKRSGKSRWQASFEIKDGAVLIAAITSCTNTSNPAVLVAAGLLARKARAAGLNVQALGEDLARARLARGDRLSRQGGIAA